MDTAIRYNLFRPMVPGDKDMLISGMASVRERKSETVVKLRPEGQHLACFTGGMLALGGKLVNNQTHVDNGEKLTDGCIWAYQVAPLGIMPETFYALPCESKSGIERTNPSHAFRKGRCRTAAFVTFVAETLHGLLSSSTA